MNIFLHSRLTLENNVQKYILTYIDFCHEAIGVASLDYTYFRIFAY